MSTKFADYRVISDQFDVPHTFNADNPDPDSRGILCFNLQVGPIGPAGSFTDVLLTITLNGKKVLEDTFQSIVMRGLHRVIPKGLLEDGTNTIVFTRTGVGTATLSDVVVFYRKA